MISTAVNHIRHNLIYDWLIGDQDQAHQELLRDNYDCVNLKSIPDKPHT